MPRAAAREASPTAAIIDAQSVKSAEKGGDLIDPHGYDAGKKIKGKKRHVLVDTEGFVLTPSSPPPISRIATAAPCRWRPCSDCSRFAQALRRRRLSGAGIPEGIEARPVSGRNEIVKRSDRQGLRRAAQTLGSRTHAGLAQPCRRLKDWENLNLKARAFLLLASIRLMVRRLCRA